MKLTVGLPGMEAIRKTRGLSRKEVADGVEVSPQFISYLENGSKNPSFSLLQKISEYLDCSIEDLLEPTDA